MSSLELHELCIHIATIGLFGEYGVFIYTVDYADKKRSLPFVLVSRGGKAVYKKDISVSTLTAVKHSSGLDGDLFKMLVHTLGIDAEAAILSCLQ